MNSAIETLVFALLCVGGNCEAAVVYPKAPDGGRPIVLKEVGNILRTDPRFLKSFRVEELTVSEPHQTYHVALTNLASGQLLSATYSGGWMYILMHGTNAVGGAGLTADPIDLLKPEAEKKLKAPAGMD